MIDIEAEIDARAKDLHYLLDLPPPTDPSTVTLRQRQILLVENVTYYSGGFRANQPGSRVSGQAYVALTGRPSPSSTVQLGYIHFVDASEVRTPVWDDTRTLIRTWTDLRFLPQTLEQLRHSQRYFWWGEFPGGHTVSDIHSTP